MVRRRPKGVDDVKRPRWQADMLALLMDRYGVEPLGVEVMGIVDTQFATGQTPAQCVQAIGDRFKLADLETWTEAQP